MEGVSEVMETLPGESVLQVIVNSKRITHISDNAQGAERHAVNTDGLTPASLAANIELAGMLAITPFDETQS